MRFPNKHHIDYGKSIPSFCSSHLTGHFFPIATALGRSIEPLRVGEIVPLSL